MSEYNFDVLKAASDDNIPFLNRKIAFTTAQVLIDSLQQFQRLIKSYRIVNRDAIAQLTYRIKSPSGTLETVEQSTEISDDDWTSFLEINPNAVSGNGIVELELVKPIDAQQQRSFHGR